VEFDIGLGAIRCYLNDLTEEWLDEVVQSDPSSDRPAS
jgi:hypothetical protein